MCCPMQSRLLIGAAFAAGLCSPVSAAPRHAAPHTQSQAATGPSELGTFGDWTVARYQRAGQSVCYAFTRAKSPRSAEAGSTPLLTVTERPASRDEVAITTPAAFPKGASVTVQVDQSGLDFYTAGNDAFARDGKAAVAALRRGGQAIMRGPGARGGQVTDTFALQGFGSAYDLLTKSCPGS